MCKITCGRCEPSEKFYLGRYNDIFDTAEKQYYPYMKTQSIEEDACCYLHELILNCCAWYRDSWFADCYNCCCAPDLSGRVYPTVTTGVKNPAADCRNYHMVRGNWTQTSYSTF
jgi:hypothetical protein